MVLQGLFTLASSLVVGAVAVATIFYTVNYLHNRIRFEDPIQMPSSNQTFNNWNGYDSSDEINCSICLFTIELKSSAQLPCGHTFHNTCINNLTKTSKKCPNCRKTFG